MVDPSSVRRVFVCSRPDQDAEAGETVYPHIWGSIFHLQNPQSGARVCYVLAGRQLQELHWYKPSLASWFIGDSVCEDGSLYLATPVDPLFIVLPLLEQARMRVAGSGNGGKFRDLGEILYVPGYPGYSQLESLVALHAALICDVKEVGSSRYYRLSDTKAMAWLLCKLEQTMAALRASGESSVASLGDADLRAYAAGLLSEYLPADTWHRRLCLHASIDLTTPEQRPHPTPPPPPAVSQMKAVTKGNKSTKLSHPPPSSRRITSFFARPR